MFHRFKTRIKSTLVGKVTERKACRGCGTTSPDDFSDKAVRETSMCLTCNRTPTESAMFTGIKNDRLRLHDLMRPAKKWIEKEAPKRVPHNP
mgnify:FL=1|tara:strand:+ start:5993 stop:6268 length:276 start_codon:yes stop_codon:yes gene_type:complete